MVLPLTQMSYRAKNLPLHDTDINYVKHVEIMSRKLTKKAKRTSFLKKPILNKKCKA